ncbi:hypothetical protein AaE_004874 [Aphanomyces astaci]|uniref:ATPase AAA-type core domain-containing protein n=1 Tax=Aphanomyces astaci TaxID=112090 RepID=A0A6A5AHY3_APHAT|nr:hypothetical protein AaE_004874 [Aphanomyces astaci]
MDEEEYDEWELMYGNDLEAENEMNAMEMELSTPTAAPPPKSAPVLATPSSATVPAVVVVAADEPLEMEVDVEYEPNSLVKEVRDEDRYISRRPSLDTPSIACVLASGERVFIKKKEHEFAFEKAATNKPVQWKLGSSIKTLLESINQRAIEAVVEADRRREENQGGEHAVEAVKESDLWLNKYSPRHFIDLLSDERTNREVLTWLKSWDPVVFPSKSSKAPSKALPDQLKPLNADIRPEHKIILICGPPGAGKTTLASIAARHAGYNPVEINASDDRTAGVLKEKVLKKYYLQEFPSLFSSWVD